MKKLRLQLDDLQVETFQTETLYPRGEGGTVRGNAAVAPGGTGDCVATQPIDNSARCPVSDPVRETDRCLTYVYDTCFKSCPQHLCGSDVFDTCYGEFTCYGGDCTKLNMCP